MMRFARSHCSFEHNYRAPTIRNKYQYGCGGRRIFPTPTINSVLSIIKGASVPAKRWYLPDHTINTFMKEFVNTCQYTEYPNKKPPILRANSYRKNVEEPLK
ncbi:unnamed protein product [Rhizophagus irregularis]|uniref:Uncharacterized protein n=1 Tax=Rhizophagus irregularis TaxID=588596 RepID=A0A915ZJS3_9GLOM|nr:unnamed protein product [Rhizophagus irregularis]